MNLILNGKLKNRAEIDAADLYVLLNANSKAPATGCNACFVQLPFRVDRHEAHAPNWEPSCRRRAARVAPHPRGLVLEYGMLYDCGVNGGGAY